MAEPEKEKKEFIYNTKVKWEEQRKGKLSCGGESEGKPIIDMGTGPEFHGHEGVITPEDLFVASINSCIMTTFLTFAEKLKVDFTSYECDAEGILSLAETPYRFTKVTVRPTVKVKSDEGTKKAIRALELAEKYCLVSNSIKVEVKLEPKVTVKGE